MSLPREPRQKMINMMYLVLTALLALNVSSEILNAFKTVNNSLEKTNTTVNNSTKTVMESLTDKMSDPTTRERATLWQPKAKQVVDLSKNVYDYIQGLKDQILTEAGGKPGDPNKSFKEDNLDIATRIMVDKGEGKKLHDALAKYKADVLAVDPLIKQNFENSLQIDLTKPPTKNKGNNTWEAAYFRMVPTVAAMTILSKFQNDVKTSENKVVSFCHEQVGKVTVRFDTYTAIVGQSTTYAMPGQKIDIMAGVGAFSKQALPKITINGEPVPIGEDGAAHKEIAAGAIGDRSVPVRIEYVDQEGKPQVIERKIEYTVGQANASIALDKMNVLYIGVDNPITIAASGGGDDRVKATINNGSLIKAQGPGKYIARVSKIDDNTVVTVTVDGKVAGASQFRVRTIPEAQAYVGGRQSGSQIGAGEFKAQGGVQAGIKNFPFELSYEVVSYTFTCDTDDDIVSIPATGAAFSGQVRNAMAQHVKPDRMVTIENIRVKGPDGRVTSAPSLLYYIK
ncbi:MAG TPA: gliding motility protein GldM [Chitinophagaceae bacterium]